MKQKLTTTLTTVILLCLTLLCIVVPASAAADTLSSNVGTETTYSVGSLKELKDAVEAINKSPSSSATITLTENIALDKTGLTFSAGSTTLLGNGHSLILDKTTIGTAIKVIGTAKLSLGKSGYTSSLTITGNNCTGMQHPAITVGISQENSFAELSMYSGVILKDYAAGSSGGAGGVKIFKNAVFNMYGGVIDNCSYGAALAGGVVTEGTFNLTGGTISNCQAKTGAGVAVLKDGVMNFNDGKISGCTATTGTGGGVYIMGTTPGNQYSPSFTMTGGVIENCSAGKDGGGIYFCYGDAILSNATIRDCRSGENGGGIAIFRSTDGNTNCQITNCTITGCNAGKDGGGLWTYRGFVTITDAILTGNNADSGGGGIANVGGTMKLQNTGVYMNTAHVQGDDIFSRCHEEKFPATLDFCDTVSGTELNGEKITGWYEDGNNSLGSDGTALRWGNLLNTGYYCEEISDRTITLTEINKIFAVKAAYDKNSVKYTITFETLGGSEPTPKSVLVKKGEKVSAPSTKPEKNGYCFAGWYRSEDNGNTFHEEPYDFNATVTENFTLYAIWIPLFTVTYDLDGGAGNGDYSEKILPYGTTFTLAAAPVKEGHTFIKWQNRTTAFNPGEEIVIFENTTFTAQWEKNQNPPAAPSTPSKPGSPTVIIIPPAPVTPPEDEPIIEPDLPDKPDEPEQPGTKDDACCCCLWWLLLILPFLIIFWLRGNLVYRILKRNAKEHNYEYERKQLKKTAKEIKRRTRDKEQYGGWREDNALAARLEAGIAHILDLSGYPEEPKNSAVPEIIKAARGKINRYRL